MAVLQAVLDALDGMVAGEFKAVHTEAVTANALYPRTIANFGTNGGAWTTNEQVEAAVGLGVGSYAAFSSPMINTETMQVYLSGGGHSDGLDGSIYELDMGNGTWSVALKSGKYETSTPTEDLTITGATNANPVVITVSAAMNNQIGTADGMKVSFSGVGGMTQLNGNTYHLVKLTNTTFELYNVDGTRSAKYTSLNGTGFGTYTSGGTASVVMNGQSVGSNSYYAQASADGIYMPASIHRYHMWAWDTNNQRFMLGGYAVGDATGGIPQNTYWFFEPGGTPEIYPGYNDPTGGNDGVETTYGGPWTQGQMAYNPDDDLVYCTTGTVSKAFQYRTFRIFSDASSMTTAAYNGGFAFNVFSRALVFPDPGNASQQLIWGPNNVNGYWMRVNDLSNVTNSASAMQRSQYSNGTMTGGISQEYMGVTYDDENTTLVYWDCQNNPDFIGEINEGAGNPLTGTYANWETNELTSSPTGDIPTTQGGGIYHSTIVKVPGRDAYLLANTDRAWLYARTDQPSGGGGFQAAWARGSNIGAGHVST